MSDTTPSNEADDEAPHRGRPTKYEPEFCEIAHAMCERGATNADLAIHFGVALSTIWLWQTTHAAFFESCKLGKSVADERVKQSFFMRAVGYEHEARKVMQYEGAPVYARYTEHVPPDVNAAKFWLINRCPDEFKDSQHIKHDTPTDSPLAMLARELAGTAIRPKEDCDKAQCEATTEAPDNKRRV